MSQVQIVFWDVQHGHATYIRTPNDRHIVIDLGTGDYSGRNETFSPLLHLRNRYGIKQLDYVVITHPHKDHIDDILNFDLMSPRVLHRPRSILNSAVMDGIREQDRPKFEKYCEINDRYNTSIAGTWDDPDIPNNWGGVELQVFAPSGDFGTNFNNASLITVVSYDGMKAVIPGDNEKGCLQQLLTRTDFQHAIQDADILLAPHHGRESGYLSEFVRAVNPRLSIVSDGRFCDTSANQCYSSLSRGWLVHTGSTSEQRKCLTTNSDGEVYVNFGTDQNNERFLHVRKAEKARAYSAY